MIGAIWSVLMSWIGTLDVAEALPAPLPSDDSGGGMDPNGHR